MNQKMQWENSKQNIKLLSPTYLIKEVNTKGYSFKKNTSGKGIFKIARLKTGHSMLKGHKKAKSTLKPHQNAPPANWKKPQNIFF